MYPYKCPICTSSAELKNTLDYGDKSLIDCSRCGLYVVSGTALAMLANRTAVPQAAARLSHAIRRQTSAKHPIEINSVNLDRLLSEPLPPIQTQLENLIGWLKGQVGENYLGDVTLPDGAALAAIVGASNEESAYRLLVYAAQEKLVRSDPDYRKAALLPPAWSQQDTNKQAPKMQPAPDKIRGHCPTCNADRNADVMASYEHRWDHETVPIWSIDYYRVLKCKGCDAVYIQHAHLFSENESIDEDPVTGEWKQRIEPEISYWPNPVKRDLPDWHQKISDEVLRSLFKETYDAFNSELLTLAAMGVRTILDRGMEILGADANAGFAAKLAFLEEQRIISTNEKDIFLVTTDAGSAASHRGWKPETNEMETILGAADAFVYRFFILANAADQMKGRIPPRPSKKP